MEEKRFDAVTRTLGGAAPRRGAVQGVGAVTLGLLAALGLRGAVTADKDGKPNRGRANRKSRNRNRNKSSSSSTSVTGGTPTPREESATGATGGASDETGTDGLVQAEKKAKARACYGLCAAVVMRRCNIRQAKATKCRPATVSGSRS